MRNIRILILLLFAGSLLYAQAADQSDAYGRITGTVLDENGQLVDHASVCTSVTKGNETNVTCNVLTGVDGRFDIGHLKIGSYGVFAAKEQDGYSASQPHEQKVIVTASDPSADITVRLGPKDGILIGSVKDKNSGKPILDSRISYLAVDNGNSGSFGGAYNDGRFRITVPARTNLVIVISASGYKGWVYTDAANPSLPVLRLESGEEKVLDVALERAAPAATPR